MTGGLWCRWPICQDWHEHRKRDPSRLSIQGNAEEPRLDSVNRCSARPRRSSTSSQNPLWGSVPSRRRMRDDGYEEKGSSACPHRAMRNHRRPASPVLLAEARESAVPPPQSGVCARSSTFAHWRVEAKRFGRVLWHTSISPVPANGQNPLSPKEPQHRRIEQLASGKRTMGR